MAELWATSTEDPGPPLTWLRTPVGDFYATVPGNLTGQPMTAVERILEPVVSLHMTFLAPLTNLQPYTLEPNLVPSLEHAFFANVTDAALMAPFTNNGTIRSLKIIDSTMAMLDLSDFTNLSSLALSGAIAAPVLLPRMSLAPSLSIALDTTAVQFEAPVDATRAYTLYITTASAAFCRQLHSTSFGPPSLCGCENVTLVCSPQHVTPSTPRTTSGSASAAAATTPAATAVTRLSTGSVVGLIVGCAAFFVLLVCVALYYQRQRRALKAAVLLSSSSPRSEVAFLEARSPRALVASLPDPSQAFRDAFADWLLPLEKEKTAKIVTSRQLRVAYLDGFKVALLPIKVTAADKSAFIAGVQRLRRLPQHPNLLPLLGASVINHRTEFAVAVAFAERGSLAHVLQRPEPALCAVSIALGVARGLAALHEVGVVYGTLTPRRVLLDKALRSQLNTLRLLDAADGKTPVCFGTDAMAYTAPEVLRGEAPTAAADIFALGLVLGYVTTGARPYATEYAAHGFVHGDVALWAAARAGRRVEAFKAQPAGEIAQLLAACTATAGGERPTSAQVAAVLEQLVAA
ncbi:hypothetical protein ACHHYP_13278 [Achlya hypogyna]|uniref:Protein kinase domain-containing protein n=1 Tax=Achlya hypogyna TaxID=1202772 RepID=A0A1V9YFP4_ACHHY|nr:hypothetical protein ACHHYP_13278 [Achlya hypogyna]